MHVPADSTKRRRTSKSQLEFYESPAPHDRHLSALTTFSPSDALAGTILRGVPARCEHVRIIQGPPGTGKTRALLDELVRYRAAQPEARCLVCAASNVCVADIYRRALERGGVCVGSLALAKEHMPPGTPKADMLTVGASKVVFSTIAGRSGRLLWTQWFDAVFVDEAAHVTEGHVLGLLRREVAHFVQCGDTVQLPAIVSPAVRALGFGRSLMERLIDIGVEHETLEVQHRMHEDIAHFVSHYFYGGRLRTSSARTPHEALLRHGRAPAAYGLVHVGGVETRVGTSFENVLEAECVLREAARCREMGLRVAILAPYAAQMRRLLAAQTGVPVLTVDAAQGKEYDAVILSIVRVTSEGFFADSRRLNVALTRAKHVLRVVLNCDAWRGHRGAIGSMVADAERRGLQLS